MKSPWKSIKALEPNREYVVLASSIPPREEVFDLALVPWGQSRP